MPFTPLIPSTGCKGTFCERYSSILFAIAGPIPGNESKSFAEAVLILILLPRNETLWITVEVKYYVDMISRINRLCHIN